MNQGIAIKQSLHPADSDGLGAGLPGGTFARGSSPRLLHLVGIEPFVQQEEIVVNRVEIALPFDLDDVPR